MGRNVGLSKEDVQGIVYEMLHLHGQSFTELQDRANFLLEMNTVNKRIFGVILHNMNKTICPQCKGQTCIGLVDCLMCGQTGVVDLKEPSDEE